MEEQAMKEQEWVIVRILPAHQTLW